MFECVFCRRRQKDFIVQQLFNLFYVAKNTYFRNEYRHRADDAGLRARGDVVGPVYIFISKISLAYNHNKSCL